jgi:large subunit ribosomal protein L9
MAESLSGKTIRLVRKTAGGSTKLFGAVTAEHIAEGIKEQLGVEIDRKHIALLHPIKRLGVYDILIDLHREVEATIRLEVADEFGNLGIEIPREVSEELKALLGEEETPSASAEEAPPPPAEAEQPAPKKRGKASRKPGS